MDEYAFKYYENVRERLTSQGDRLWNRFNYFLTIEAALVGAFFVRPDGLGGGQRLYGLVSLGIAMSVVWFLIAAQDLWFYEDRYERLKQLETSVILPKVPFTYDSSWASRLPSWKRGLCFKVPQCGSTTFSAISPLLFIILWFGMLLYEAQR